ncbi:gamma-mobile-trio integrase GmtZ [Shewanella psychromarinicola]|uniref:Integrase n=1 Tax=Shewanella psychromarinicola TaxID=2487742 RepID=A0A3N4EWK8_9GAMM|nr:VPA1269 family protein [Shewanella psychromarinicola]AZG34806.1 integrase [Shewanella psychromarinicola]MCL1083758.1 tyrosine-type recombinase/integrase [Shewanella psychromarinicola]RPA33404.1 integrase [Shewanella psychromarinicola]
MSKYKTLEEASKMAIKLGIKSKLEYLQNYKKDPKLPADPLSQYKGDMKQFGGWYGFLGKKVPNFYNTFEEASKMAIKLGIKSRSEYLKHYRKDPKLPANPFRQYKGELKHSCDWYSFLGNDAPNYYSTIEDASKAAIKRGIKTRKEYLERYKEDPKLPRVPDHTYSDEWESFGGLCGFLDKEVISFYRAIEEASEAVIKLGIKTGTEYSERYKEDPKLPSEPSRYYGVEWTNFESWDGFLGREPIFYNTIEEASKAVIKLRIKSITEYRERYKEDPNLPSNPNKTYSDDWNTLGGWYSFFGKEAPDYYNTVEEASQAAIKLGFQGSDEYKQGYKEDPKLPSNPNNTYSDDWNSFGGWYSFLGKVGPDFYNTFEEASKAVIKLGFQSSDEYKQGYKEDPRLPSTPQRTYSDHWNILGGWYGYLDKEAPDLYRTLEEASEAAINLGIMSATEYKKRYKEDPRLTFNPNIIYSDDWDNIGNWVGFLGKEPKDFYRTIEEASRATIKLGLVNAHEYRKRYKEDPRLPLKPSELYSDDWKGFGRWRGFVGMSKNYSRTDIGIKFNSWLDLYDSYIEQCPRGLVMRQRVCIPFICKFIMENNHPAKPEGFLLKTTKVNRKSYEEFLEHFKDDNKSKFHSIVIEFIDYCLHELCTLEDDDEVIVHPDFGNHFINLQSPLFEIKQKRLAESDKPVLAYGYVVKAKEWILPAQSKDFCELTHLHGLVESDWSDIDPSLIDTSDPDCVYRYVEKDRRESKHTGKLIGRYNETVCQIWSPSRFLAVYTLLSVPARGQQILWCDSGEADKRIPQLVKNKVEWVTNTSLLAGHTKKQGFIKEYQANELGLHFSTNKTSFHEGGYDIPWMPENLDYWMIKLRNWQSKYNAIIEPTKWTELVLRIPIGNKILKQRGANCFLFRMGNSNTPHQQPIFGKALAYVLHQIEHKDNPLTNQVNDNENVGSYKSDYTPHSMRVSLITAFVIDAKVPIHIVQKLVGHTRLVMTIYYTKIGHAEMRDELNAANKRALAESPYKIQQQIRNKQFEAVRDSLIAADPLAFKNLSNDHPTSAFAFTDIGICPMGGGKCDQGGEVVNDQVKQKKYLPVASGHLGEKNCIRCRFFITSPAFLGGLTAVFNEISLKKFYIKQKEKDLIIHIESLEDEQYDTEKLGNAFAKTMELEKATSNLETIAKETSMYATDTVHIARLISQCVDLLNNTTTKDGEIGTTLVTNSTQSSLDWSLDETNSEFHQLSTVCENATIYALSDASLANARRSQLIDNMASQNGIDLRLCMLSPKQQLEVGNQMSELLKSRLKSWENVEKVMRADILLNDFTDSQQLIPLHDEVKNILLGKPVNQLAYKKNMVEGV